VTRESNRKAGKVQTFLALLQTEPTEMDCQQCIEQLTDYIDLQLEAGDYQHQFPTVAQHLDNCVSCAEMYARVYEVALADRNGHFDTSTPLSGARLKTGRLPQPSRIPEPDLSFLSNSPSLWATLQTALQQTQTRLTLQLDAALAAWLTPPPSLALTRSGDDARFGEQILSLTPDQVPETDLPFSLAAYADKENEALCLVEITVEPPGLSWPDLGGSEVQLRYGDVVLAEKTDDWGTAVFANIPRTELENLHMEIHIKQI
jgi:hypothetical protein